MPHPRATRAWVSITLVAALGGACGGSDEPATAPTTTTRPTSGATGADTTGQVAAPSSTSTTEAVRVIEVSFAGGQVVGGARRETVELGEKVRLRVTSDVADRVHVHTYDMERRVGPGQPAELELEATIPGRHEVELEERHRQLLTLEVR